MLKKKKRENVPKDFLMSWENASDIIVMKKPNLKLHIRYSI